MDIRTFVKDVLDHMLDQCDEDIEAFALEHGLLVSRSLTAVEAANKDAPWYEYGCEAGDSWLFYTPALKAWLAEEQ